MKIKLTCEICSKVFYKYKSYLKYRSGRFCSRDCNLRYQSISWKLDNPTKYFDNSGPNNPMFGKIPHNFKPDGSKRKDGYIRISIKERGRLLKHRVIMEKYIGRKLLDKEIIHHVDGNKSNNSLDNLKIMTQSEHARLHATIRNSRGKSLICDENQDTLLST